MAISKIGVTYRAEVFIGSKRVIAKCGFKNKSLAKAWHDEQKVLLRNNPMEPSNDKRNFSDLIEKYVEDYVNTNLKETTRMRYLLDINERIIPEFGEVKIIRTPQPGSINEKPGQGEF